MSFLSDLFHGNFGNLGNDLNPSNIFSDTVKDIGGKNTLEDLGLLAGGLAIAAPFALPALGALDLGGGVAAGAIDPSLAAGAADAALPVNATLTAGTVPDSLAGLVGGDMTTIGPGVSATGSAVDAAGAPLNLAGTALGATPASTAGGGGVLSTITNSLAPVANTIKTVAPIAGLAGTGFSLYEGYQTNQANKALAGQEAANAAQASQTAATENAAAAPLLSSGQTLMSYLTTGTLPQAFQSQVKQAIDSAKAGIIQGYASRGQSTDPKQNSALQQDLANVDLQAESLKANLESTLSTAGNQMVTTANQLLASGLSATQLASELPIQVANLNSNLNAQMSSALSNFAAALNGSGVKPGTVNLQLPPNALNSNGTLTLQ